MRQPEIEVSGIGQALARDIINDIEHAKASAAGEPMRQIQRPARIGHRLDEDQRTHAYGTPAGFALTKRKPFLAIKTIDAVADRRPNSRISFSHSC